MKPGILDSRNCGSYSSVLCLIRIHYKRSHFTKPARVSLTSPAINKWVTITYSCGAGAPGSQALFRRLLRKQRLVGLKPEALVFESCRLWHEARLVLLLLLLQTQDPATGLLQHPQPSDRPKRPTLLAESFQDFSECLTVQKNSCETHVSFHLHRKLMHSLALRAVTPSGSSSTTSPVPEARLAWQFG